LVFLTLHSSVLMMIILVQVKCSCHYPWNKYFKILHSLFSGSIGIWTQGFVMLGRYSTTWAILPDFFVLVILETGSCICQGQSGSQSSYFMLFAAAGMAGIYHHAQLLFFPLRWGITKIFPRLSSNYDPPDLDLPSS
jgi:hypothetical protein